jgi:hypothetical protein
VRIAVVDSSALINLTELGLATKLSLYFDTVFVPNAVQREVNRKARFRYRLKALYRTRTFQRCRAADVVNVRLLLLDLHEGEAEALTQAQEKFARFFIADDRRARQIGEKRGLTPVGTLRLLARLNLEGHAPEVKALVHKLRRELGFRVSEAVVQEALAMAPKPI